MIKVICMDCKVFMENIYDNKPVTVLSHGLCPKCYKIRMRAADLMDPVILIKG